MLYQDIISREKISKRIRLDLIQVGIHRNSSTLRRKHKRVKRILKTIISRVTVDSNLSRVISKAIIINRSLNRTTQ